VQLAKLPTVAETRTIIDYVPKAQDEKLEILETASYFVPPAITPGPPVNDGQRRAALQRLSEEAGRVTGDDALATSSARLRRAIEQFLAGPGGGPDHPEALALLEKDLVGSLPDQIRDLQQLLTPQRVSLGDLPDQLRGQMLAVDGRARVQVLPKEDVGDVRLVLRHTGDVLVLGHLPPRERLAAFLGLREQLVARVGPAEYWDLRFRDRIYARPVAAPAPAAAPAPTAEPVVVAPEAPAPELLQDGARVLPADPTTLTPVVVLPVSTTAPAGR
jgi:hypothetical protein